MMKKTWWKIAAFPLGALALGMATMAAFPEGFSATHEAIPGTDFSRVTWKDAAPRVAAGEWLLVDARDEENFTAQHIPGALSLPANAYPEMIQFFAEEHGTIKTVVVYCGTEECDLSNQLAARLRDEAGCRDIRVLEGGFLAWQRSQ